MLIFDEEFSLSMFYKRNPADEDFRPSFAEYFNSVTSIKDFTDVRVEPDRFEKTLFHDKFAMIVYCEDTLVGHVPYVNSPVVYYLWELEHEGLLENSYELSYEESNIVNRAGTLKDLRLRVKTEVTHPEAVKLLEGLEVLPVKLNL